MIVAAPRLNPLNHFQLVGPHMATLNEHPSSEAVLILSHVDVSEVITGSQEKNFSPNNGSTVAVCHRSAMSVRISLTRMCVSVCEVDMCMYVRFVPFMLCSVGPKWKPLVFQGAYRKIAIVPA